VLATAHLDASVKFWSVATGESVGCVEELHQSQVTGVEYSGDGTTIVTNSRDHTVKLVDTRSLEVVRTMTGTKTDEYKNMCNWNRAVFSPDGKFITAGGADASIFVWETGTGKLVTKFTAHNPSTSPSGQKVAHMTSVDWNRDGRQIASTDSDGHAVLWE
jgi:autophagy-related protein 16